MGPLHGGRAHLDDAQLVRRNLAKRRQLARVYSPLPGCLGQNLALTVLCVPYLRDGGEVWHLRTLYCCRADIDDAQLVR